MRYPFNPIYRKDFTPTRAIVSNLYDTVAKFGVGVKFSLRVQQPGRTHAGVSRAGVTFCSGNRATRGKRNELAPVRSHPGVMYRPHYVMERTVVTRCRVMLMAKCLNQGWISLTTE